MVTVFICTVLRLPRSLLILCITLTHRCILYEGVGLFSLADKRATVCDAYLFRRPKDILAVLPIHTGLGETGFEYLAAYEMSYKENKKCETAFFFFYFMCTAVKCLSGFFSWSCHGSVCLSVCLLAILSPQFSRYHFHILCDGMSVTAGADLI